jgi:glutathione S-transferase
MLRFTTYFPHVDNVYSHRSTQRYKRKPFISHYWDCRLKGRPAGTPKSDDPNKKKRKRVARERDLCDVKIKITEYLPGTTREEIAGHLGQPPSSANPFWNTIEQMLGATQDPWDAATAAIAGGQTAQSQLGVTTKRFFTVQRVNGTNVNSKVEEIAGGHRHSLADSDRIKKNSVVRWRLKNEKAEKDKMKVQQVRVNFHWSRIPCISSCKSTKWDDRGGARKSNGHCITPLRFPLRHPSLSSMSCSRLLRSFNPRLASFSLLRPQPLLLHPSVFHTSATRYEFTTNTTKMADLDANQKQDPAKKTYHKKATGPALATVKRHSKEDPLKLFGGCFCPFVQRVWISLEHKGIPYQYIEVDPYKKPEALLAINPRGLIPAIKHGNWGCYESSVLMEYLEDLEQGPMLLPRDAKFRATSRLWSDHINRHIVPSFYRYLQEQDSQKQVEHATEFKTEITKLVDAADPIGPFFLGPQMTFVDVQIAPWVLRLRRVLKPYRGWPEPEPGSRWAKWVEAIEGNEAIRATTSTDELYLDSYERYAENRPNTSQVANAVNSGRGLP